MVFLFVVHQSGFVATLLKYSDFSSRSFLSLADKLIYIRMWIVYIGVSQTIMLAYVCTDVPLTYMHTCTHTYIHTLYQNVEGSLSTVYSDRDISTC